MSSVVQIMATALAWELRERDIVSLEASACEAIVESMLKRTGEACDRFLARRADGKPRPV